MPCWWCSIAGLRSPLCESAGADLAVQVGHPRSRSSWPALVLEALLPDLDRRVDAAEAQRDVALLLADPRAAPRRRAAGRSRRRS